MSNPGVDLLLLLDKVLPGDIVIAALIFIFLFGIILTNEKTVTFFFRYFRRVEGELSPQDLHLAKFIGKGIIFLGVVLVVLMILEDNGLI